MPLFALGESAPVFPQDGAFWVAPTAVLIGRVRLMRNASIWFGAVLRGDNEWITVGENSNVQDNCVLHADPGEPLSIGNNVTLGHAVIAHSAVIGDDCLIGIGSAILNRARIGRGSIVGANTLVSEGKEFPDRALILGSPGRLIRTLTEEDFVVARASVDTYLENQKRFRDHLKLVS